MTLAAVRVILVAAAFVAERSVLGAALLGVLGVTTILGGRVRAFAVAIGPYVVLWATFGALRALADETILARTLNTQVPSLERHLFGGRLPTTTLQDRFFDPSHLHWYDYLATMTHWSFFVVPHLVALRLWQRDPLRFARYRLALALLLSLGLLIYFLLPTNPPWLAPEPIDTPAAPPVYRVMAIVGAHVGGGFYRASYRVVGESNPLAAMPSIHFAVTFLLVFVAWDAASRRWRCLAAGYAVLMALSLVYLGEHYVLDVAVGALVTTYAWFGSATWLAAPHRVHPAATHAWTRPPSLAGGIDAGRVGL